MGASSMPLPSVIHGDLDMRLHPGVESLPHDMRVSGMIFLDDVMLFDGASVWMGIELAETVQAAMVGRTLGDVVQHRLLSGHPAEDAVVTKVEYAGWQDGPLIIDLDRDPFPAPIGPVFEADFDDTDLPF